VATGARVTARRAARRETIGEAVFELLAEVGYDQMSMDAVATRAKASKATLYRSWPSKPDMVVDAIIQHFGGPPPAPDTGALRDDLIALTASACEWAQSRDGAVMVGLMSAAARNPDLAETLHRCTHEVRDPTHRTIVERAVARGELPECADPVLLHEVLDAVVFARRLSVGAALDDDFVEHVVDHVLLPVLRNQPGA
jgi:AcrR family transcriptional regulator